MKNLRIILCLTACLLALSGCNGLAEKKAVDESTSQELVQTAQIVVAYAFSSLDEASAAQLTSQGTDAIESIFAGSFDIKVDGDAMISAFDSWNKAIAKVGAAQRFMGYSVAYSANGDSIIVDIPVEAEEGTVRVEFVFDNDPNHTITSVSTKVVFTFAEWVENIGVNTMAVFAVIIVVLMLLTAVITYFAVASRIRNSFRKRDQVEEKEMAVNNTIAQIIEKEERTDETEMLAVITAIIAASKVTGQIPGGGNVAAGAGGFIARKIKRTPGSRWGRI